VRKSSKGAISRGEDLQNGLFKRRGGQLLKNKDTKGKKKGGKRKREGIERFCKMAYQGLVGGRSAQQDRRGAKTALRGGEPIGFENGGECFKSPCGSPDEKRIQTGMVQNPAISKEG